jgi:hypothetical protein
LSKVHITKQAFSEETTAEVVHQDSAIPQQINQLSNMEVHHHPEVEKKGFKGYLLEGLMIFIGVSMDFLQKASGNIWLKKTGKSNTQNLSMKTLPVTRKLYHRWPPG